MFTWSHPTTVLCLKELFTIECAISNTIHLASRRKLDS
jgi:hypothetical protein